MKESITIAPLVSDLLLIGGGHAQVHIIKMCGMEPLRSLIARHGIRVTLIARDIMTPYSGMLPGYIAGHYTYDDIHIDLNRLCSFAGVRLIHASANSIVPSSNTTTSTGGLVYCEDGRPPLRYDALNIDVGSRPSGWGGSIQEIKEDGVTPVKPIGGFAKRYSELVSRLEQIATSYTAESPFTLLVVGGGAGGIELVLAVQHNLVDIFRKVGADEKALKMILATRGSTVLSSHNKKVQRVFKRILDERNVEVQLEANIIGMEPYGDQMNGTQHENDTNANELPILNRLLMSDSTSSSTKTTSSTPILFHECLWCTSAGAPRWLSEQTPFSTTKDGFLQVRDTFESLNHPGVFAGGDCCHNVDHPRPKAGVFAVRAGPPILKNLFNFLLNKPLEPFEPQKTFLSLITTGDKYAIACRGNFALEGQYLWRLKDWIDVSFMTKFSDLPSMDDNEDEDDNDDETNAVPANVVAKGAEAMIAFAAAPMRCGGCGAKVGATTVSRVLEAVRQRANSRRLSSSSQHTTNGNKLTTHTNNNNLKGSFEADDAAIVHLPSKGGGSAIHTIDFFRSFISDPFVFGKIAAVHAMSDCHAMGAATQTCLALAVVPYAAEESITEDTLIAMLSGASDILEADHCDLVGGHTCEGTELALGFSVNGYIDDATKLLCKSGGKVGDKIVITKPIGTGAIFAADMRAESKSVYVNEALQKMMQSSGPASRVAMTLIEKQRKKHAKDMGVHACTDVTGFGLAGHLIEMLTANDVKTGKDLESIEAKLYLDEIPFYDGAINASTKGIYSSLQRENFRSRRAVKNHVDAAKASPIKYPLLFDPQTAGGLLFFVSPDFCDTFVAELKKSENGGFAQIIGELIPHEVSAMEEEGVCTIGGGGKNSGKRITIQY